MDIRDLARGLRGLSDENLEEALTKKGGLISKTFGLPFRIAGGVTNLFGRGVGFAGGEAIKGLAKRPVAALTTGVTGYLGVGAVADAAKELSSRRTRAFYGQLGYGDLP